MTTDSKTGTARPVDADRPARAAALPPDERRASIVAAATPLLRQYGRDVTTRQIADAAGIAEGTIFRVFATKEEIIEAVTAQIFDLGEVTARIRAIDLDLPLADRVRACATVLTDRLTWVIDLMMALHRGGPDDSDGPGTDRGRGHRHTHHRRGEDHAEVLAAAADLLRPDAHRLTCTPERAVHLLRLMAFAGTHSLINDGDALTADEITEVLLHGIVRPGNGER